MQAAMIGQRCQSTEWADKLDDSFGMCVKDSICLLYTSDAADDLRV